MDDRLVMSETTTIRELQSLRQVLSEVGETFAATSTAITPGRTSHHGSAYTVELTEDTRLRYSGSGSAVYTEYVAHHRFTFSATRMVSHQLTDDGPAPITEPTGVTAAEARRALRAAGAYDPDPRTAHPAQKPRYKPTVASDYAETYWKKYNKHYRRFDGRSDGGDCTNFVSQSVHAGGWAYATGWYRNAHHWWYGKHNQSWAWVGAPYFHDFAVKYSKRAHALARPSNLDWGDVFQGDLHNKGRKVHSMIVTYVFARQQNQWIPLVTYHSPSTFRRSIFDIIAKYPSAI
ncbi:hypothetical protein GCM10029978_110870 [Actinoallomurus acanthiterrae]